MAGEEDEDGAEEEVEAGAGVGMVITQVLMLHLFVLYSFFSLLIIY